MSKITGCRNANDYGVENWLFCTPPHEEMEAIAEAAAGVETHERISPTLWLPEDLDEIRSLTPSDEELDDHQFQSVATGFDQMDDYPDMPTIGKPLAESVGCSKSGTSSAHSHLPTGRLEGSRSLGSKSQGLQDISHLHDSSDGSQSRKSQQACALLQLTGYSSSEEEHPNDQPSTQAQRVKHQRRQVKNGSHKRLLAAKYKSPEFVESHSSSEVDVSGVHARPSLNQQDSASKSGRRRLPSTNLDRNAYHTGSSRNLKGTHNGSLSRSRDTERRFVVSPRRSQPTVTVTKHGGKSMNRRVMPSSTPRVDTKRPKLLGGFVDDNESELEPDFQSDGSEASENSDDRGEDEPGSDLEITVNWRSQATKLPSKQAPVGIRRPTQNPAPQPPQKGVNFSRLQKLIRDKEATAAKRATPSNAPSNEANTTLVRATGSKPAQTMTRGAQSSSAMNPSDLKRGPASLTPNSASDRSTLGGTKLLPAKITSRGAVLGDSVQVNDTSSRGTDLRPGLNALNPMKQSATTTFQVHQIPPRPTSLKPGLHALSTIKAVQNASRSARIESQPATRPGSVLPPAKKLASTTNRLDVPSSTAAAGHRKQDSASGVPLQGSNGASGNAGVVGDLIQGIRQGGKLNTLAATDTSTSAPTQAKKTGGDGQMQQQPRNVVTNLHSQRPHQIRSGLPDSFGKPIATASAQAQGTIDSAKSGSKTMANRSGPANSSCTQTESPHHSTGMPTSGVIDSAKSLSETTAALTTEPRPASRTPTPHTLKASNARNFQAFNGVSPTQKRKAENMTSGPAVDTPLAKRTATEFAKLNASARSSTDASEPTNSIAVPSSSKSKAVPASSAGKKATTSMPTSTTNRKPQETARTVARQEKATMAPPTENHGPHVQKHNLQNFPQEVAPDSNPTICEALSIGTDQVQPRNHPSLGSSQQQSSALLARTENKKSGIAIPKDTQAQRRTQTPDPKTSTAREPLAAAANAFVKKPNPAIQTPQVPIVAQAHGAKARQVSNQVPQEQANPAKATNRFPSVHSPSSELNSPADSPKVAPKIAEKPVPAHQVAKKDALPATKTAASIASPQRPLPIASRHQSTPVVILSTSSALVPNAEPYFEYSIFQKIWSDAEDESTISTTELTSRPSTNVDELNSQAERLFDDMLRQYQEHFQVHLFERKSELDEHGCSVFKGTFAHFENLHKKSHMKLWVRRDPVSAYAGRKQKDLKHTNFIAKTVYMLRLFKLVPVTTGFDSEGSTATLESTRVYHPLPCTECYTTIDSANRAAKNLQIELSHTKTPNAMEKLWQIHNLEQLNKRARDLANTEVKDGKY